MITPFHGKLGEIVATGRGSPRNHLVRLDGGAMVIVPCGNLYRLFGQRLSD